jgi:hypothetical protein
MVRVAFADCVVEVGFVVGLTGTPASSSDSSSKAAMSFLILVPGDSRAMDTIEELSSAGVEARLDRVERAGEDIVIGVDWFEVVVKMSSIR